jgi:hypothetical protein
MKNENGLESDVEGGPITLSLVAMPLYGEKNVSQAKICWLHCRLSLLVTIMMLREGQWPIGKRALLLFAPKTFLIHMSLFPAYAAILSTTCTRHRKTSTKRVKHILLQCQHLLCDTLSFPHFYALKIITSVFSNARNLK